MMEGTKAREMAAAWDEMVVKAIESGEPATRIRLTADLGGGQSMPVREAVVYRVSGECGEKFVMVEGKDVCTLLDPTLEPALDRHQKAHESKPLRPKYEAGIREWAYSGTAKVVDRIDDLVVIGDLLAAHDYWQALAESRAIDLANLRGCLANMGHDLPEQALGKILALQSEVTKLREQVAVYKGIAEAAADSEATDGE
jgi:hypothetical protein